MGVLSWIRQALFPVAKDQGRVAAERANGGRNADVAPEDAPLPRRAASGTASETTDTAQPSPGGLMGAPTTPLDHEKHATAVLDSPEADLLWRLSARIESGNLDIPALPPTSLAALDVANRPSVEVRQLVEAIERDPLITSELLRMANSALFATRNDASSVQEAIMRVGLKAVRTVVFSAAMKSTLGAAKRLNEYSEEVWRQAQSVAAVARAIGPQAGLNRDEAYLIGLLHDLGKIALLGMLQREMKDLGKLTSALVGRTFHTFHERAGRAMAVEWKLPPSIVSVAGLHHDFASNGECPREAALAKLAHESDLRLSLRDEAGFRALVQSPALEALGVRDEAARWRVLEVARREWESHSAGRND